MSSPSDWAPTPPAAGRLAGPELLERAVGYTRTSLMLVGSTDLTARTPCADWDLLRLLRHMNDALAAFTEAAEIGYVDLVPVRDGDPGAELVDRLKNRACALLAAWAHHPGTGPVTVADRELRSDVLAAAGALEIAVHGWDVAQAVRRRPPAARGARPRAARRRAGGRARHRPSGPVRRPGRRTPARAAEHPVARRPGPPHALSRR